MMRRERNRLIVLSLDAVGSIDLPYMRTLPHFRAFMKRAAGCERVVSVYDRLLERGYSRQLCDKLFCQNAMRFFEENLT